MLCVSAHCSKEAAAPASVLSDSKAPPPKAGEQIAHANFRHFGDAKMEGRAKR